MSLIKYFIIIYLTASSSYCLNIKYDDNLKTGQFSTELLNSLIANSKANDNLIVSPVSIHNLLGLAYFGAEGKTATEISNALHLPKKNRAQIALSYKNNLNLISSPKSLIKMANKIYTNKGFSIKEQFNEIAQTTFGSEIESLDFSDSERTIEIINDWVATKTNNKINDIVDSNSFDSTSEMILLNAIHFKGEWLIQPQLHKMQFNESATESKEIDFLEVEGDFKFINLQNIDAVAAELPYKNSDISLMIIVPNSNIDLNILEDRMKNVDLMKISSKMSSERVTINIPKFQFETKLELEHVLASMGMQRMFSDMAEFNFFESNVRSKVSQVISKAFIDVNEVGTEASAAAVMSIRYASLMKQKELVVNCPFMFAIKDSSSIYFVGHLRNV